jgi:ubiquinone/menaquinone biosynthesis C-methylase UbiE
MAGDATTRPPVGEDGVVDATRAYYERRAGEYERTSWGELDDHETAAVRAALGSLAPALTLDVGIGTAFLTPSLPGRVVGMDQSLGMLREARTRLGEASLVRGDATALPFADGAFGRVFASHVYAHLRPGERERFLEGARRVAGQLVLVEERASPDSPPDGDEERVLDDGSRHFIYKRRFEPVALLDDLGGGAVLFEGEVHLVVRSP